MDMPCSLFAEGHRQRRPLSVAVAAFSLFHLVPSGAAFAAMIAVTAFNAYMAWAQDAELLALYAIVGGLSTPLLLSTGGNHDIEQQQISEQRDS